MQYEAHEYSLAFPEMPPEQFRRLSEDIRANGLLHSIVLFEGKILDGRHRYRACIQQRVEPRFREYTGSDPAAYVASENAARRHLSTSQLGMVGAKLAEIEGDRAKARQVALGRSHGAPLAPIGVKGGEVRGATADIIGKKLGIGAMTVTRAIRVNKKGAPELIAAVEAGKITVNEAEKIVQLNPDAQKKIASIEDHRERKKASQIAINRSQAAKLRDNPVPVVSEPGTPYVRMFLGDLERMAKNIASKHSVREASEIVGRFKQEMDWSSEQLRTQVEVVAELVAALSDLNLIIKSNQAAA